MGPPRSQRPVQFRHVGAGILLFLLALGGFLLYTAVFGGGALGPNADLEVESVQVGLNDGFEGDVPSVDGSGSCTSVGPPPNTGTVSLQGRIVDRTGGRVPSETSYTVVVTVGSMTDSSDVTLSDGDVNSLRGHLFMLEDDESVQPGEEAEVTVLLHAGGNTLERVTRTVTVEERDLRCVETGG